MVDNNKGSYFNDIESIIVQPLSFKAKLSIGEDAYTSLRMKNKLFEAWDTAGAVGAGAAFVQSTMVASTFFSPAGMLSLIGLGTAITPIGWVVGAGVVSGGAWVGINKYFKKASSSRVQVIPDFINTPLDVLALGLFDLIAPLALKISNVDGDICESELSHIKTYFVKEWGYDEVFVRDGLSFMQSKIDDYSIRELAQTLAEFKKGNRDCNYKPMSQEIIRLLTDIMQVDGKIDEREEMSIELVSKVFNEANKVQPKKMVEDSWRSLTTGVTKIIEKGIIPSKE